MQAGQVPDSEARSTGRLADFGRPDQLLIVVCPAWNHIQRVLGPITPLLAETLQDAEDEYPANWIEEAFRIAVEKNVRNWRYVDAILRRWHERGYDVREDRRDVEKDLQEYKKWED